MSTLRVTSRSTSLSHRFPQAFGRFWLQEKIGHGGMAEVFRATVGPDPETYAFDMALKRLHPHLEREKSQVDMFMTEADIAKFLLHDNIVRVFESGLIEGHAYIAMEYVWGMDLSQLLLRLRERHLRLPTELAVYIALQILRALDYVHRAVAPGGAPMNLVHRDVTPSNIYLTYDGHVKLADFGVARVSFIERQDDPTLKGKVSYMPPEVLGGHEVDSMVDTWSLAVTLYEMVTQRRLYEGVSETDLVAGIVAPKIEPAHKAAQDVELPLSKILSTALHKKRKKRPQEALDFYRVLKSYLADHGSYELGGNALRDALGRFLREAVGVSADFHGQNPSASGGNGFLESDYHAPIEMSPTQRIELRVKRARRWPLAIGAGVALCAAGGAWWWMSQSSDAPAVPQEPPAMPTEVKEPAPPTQPEPDVTESETPKEPVAEPKRKRRKKRRRKSSAGQ
ncbi:MAG: protein kinase [Myxococcota bacterium]